MSEDYVKSIMLDYDGSVRAVQPVEALWKHVQGQEPLNQKLTIDISLWLEGDIYLNTDRTSTACGIELHTPFSDLRLFNVASKIPPEYKFAHDQNKYVFRKAASSKLPDEVAFRKKVGFPVPVRKWLSDERFNKPICEKFFGETSKKFFDQDVLKKLWNDYLGGEEQLWGRVYAIYAFLLWYDIKFN
jgi:asparagine synthase (glutamine-hydrolysing)